MHCKTKNILDWNCVIIIAGNHLTSEVKYVGSQLKKTGVLGMIVANCRGALSHLQLNAITTKFYRLSFNNVVLTTRF